MNGLGHAFMKWRSNVKAMMKRLNGMTQEELFNLHNKCMLQLKDIAGQIEDRHTEIGDLKVQREYLIDKVVLGQRLALARCRFSFTFAKEKVWVKLNNNAVGGMRA